VIFIRSRHLGTDSGRIEPDSGRICKMDRNEG